VREIDPSGRPTCESNDPKGKKMKVFLIAGKLGNGKTCAEE
jgi:hypothetical protein